MTKDCTDDLTGVSSFKAALGVATFWFAAPVLPKLNSMSQSSSLSDGASKGMPSGRSKSASGHSSRHVTEVGAGIVAMAQS